MFVLADNNGPDDDMMLSYKGSIDAELISNILEMVESKASDRMADSRVKKKVINVLIETLQNIFHHGTPGPNQKSEDSSVMVYERGGEYMVITGNRTPCTRANELARRIDNINSMTRDELNESYRKILLTKQKSSITGAGIGFIDIARRSGQKLEYTLESIDEEYCYFSMRVKIAV